MLSPLHALPHDENEFTQLQLQYALSSLNFAAPLSKRQGILLPSDG